MGAGTKVKLDSSGSRPIGNQKNKKKQEAASRKLQASGLTGPEG